MHSTNKKRPKFSPAPKESSEEAIKVIYLKSSGIAGVKGILT